jgi:hypothetical protein
MTDQRTQAASVSRELDAAARSRIVSSSEGLTRDGAVLIPGALNSSDLAIAKQLYDGPALIPAQPLCRRRSRVACP